MTGTAGGEAVTVVVPTRNRLPVLEATLACVLGQRDVDIRVVVVDEGSSDGTPERLSRLAAADPRVRTVRHDDPRGLPAARNAGLAATETAWVAFCDDDDLWAPDKLARQLAAAAAEGAGWSCTGAVFVTGPKLSIIGHQRLVTGADALTELRQANVVPGGGSSVLARTALVREAGGFDETLRASEDWEMWIRLAERSPLAAVDAPLVGYRIWRGSMSTDVDRMRTSRIAVLERHGADHRPGRADLEYERFLAKQLLRGGEGRRAAAQFLDLARAPRNRGELTRVLPALVAPGLTDRVGSARARHRVPPEWRAEARRWLDDLPATAPHRAGSLRA